MFSGGREVMHWEKTGYCNVKWRAELSWIQCVFFYWDSGRVAAYKKDYLLKWTEFPYWYLKKGNQNDALKVEITKNEFDAKLSGE